jgi:SAM-dependent methyltransferase
VTLIHTPPLTHPLQTGMMRVTAGGRTIDKHLEIVRTAYDRTVEEHRIGVDPLRDVPDQLRQSTFFRSFASGADAPNSAAADLKAFLKPRTGMKFLDVGCCANLANYRLDKWPSAYYGVDMSPALIKAMKGFAVTHGLSPDALRVAEAAQLPFGDRFFDIAAAIGVFEYCSLRYIRRVIREMHRVMRAGARLVVDIPNREHAHVRDMARLEKFLERPIYLHFRSKFESELAAYFSLDRVDDTRVMIKFYARRLK